MAAIAEHKKLTECRLLDQGGYEVLDNFMNPAFFKQLRHEAIAGMYNASRADIVGDSSMPERGGQPARKLFSSPGGPCLQEFNFSTYVLDKLESVVGLPVVPSGSQGTFSYYAKEGDHLGLHRDVLICDLAVITSLFDNTIPDSEDGVLALYPERRDHDLADIAKSPMKKRKLVKLKQGQTIILLGGIVPHMVLPMSTNFKRIISINCYQVNDK